MSQYDFGTIDPNTKSGTALATDLNSFRTALHTSHSGSTAPSYITTGMLWVDSTSANLKIKMYDGAQSIDVAIIDATNNVARVAVDSAATSYITTTTAAQIKFVIASVDTATIRSTGLQFNIASPYIGDSSNNELLSFTTTASAVNQLNIANAATGVAPTISALGNDTNIGIALSPKGTGRTNIVQLALDGTTITTTAAQLNFVTGVTSAIQTQIDGKAPLTGTGTSGTWPISISGDAGSVDGKSMGTFTAAGGVAYATDTSTLAATGAGTAGQALLSGGASVPTWGYPAQLSTASGSAPSYACRAWVSFAGASGTVQGSGNVSSVSRTAAGSYQVNFTTAIQDANYCVSGASTGSSTGSTSLSGAGSSTDFSRATGSVTVYAVDASGNAAVDAVSVHVAIFR
jgi:hypothetical protein